MDIEFSSAIRCYDLGRDAIVELLLVNVVAKRIDMRMGEAVIGNGKIVGAPLGMKRLPVGEHGVFEGIWVVFSYFRFHI